MQAGFSAAECAEIRGLSLETVTAHLRQAARDGLVVDQAWFHPSPQRKRE
jgi:DNA-binding CsgD family transcriptional regulator